MLKRILVLSIFLSIITCCPAGKCVKNCQKNALCSIEHSITYSNKGSKSEAQHGHLFINGKEIPDVFTQISCIDKTYKFYQRKQMWGRDGYFPLDEQAQIKASSAKITDEQIKKGWYTGAEKLDGTPCPWLNVQWEGGSAFVSPDKIEDMAAAENLKPIKRDNLFMLLKQK